MRKIIISILISSILFGCTPTQDNTSTVDTSNGPVVTEDSETVEEKVLRMIQNCISDYNDHRMEEMEKYMNTSLPELPIEITSLPEIQSLDDLTPIDDDELTSNTTYAGYYMVNDIYRVVFKVYYPSGGYFWPNGELIFEIDPENIPQNNPSYAQYKSILDELLYREANILDWMYGVGVNLDYEDVKEEKYYRVLSFSNGDISSIEQLKGYAESVFEKDYLENTYYKNAFEGDSPTYKEFDGALYCQATDLTSITKNIYDTSRIIAVKEEGEDITINLLSMVMDIPQPEMKIIKLKHKNDTYLLTEEA